MKLLFAAAVAAAALAMPAAFMTGVSAQAQPQRQEPTVPIVEAVGCLSEGAKGVWMLESATDAVVSTTSFTSTEALKEAEGKPLSTQKYRLLGADPFAPAMHNGHKVFAKGALIKAPNDNRINLTSLQMVSTTCGRK